MNRIFYMAMLLVTWLSFAPSYADDVAKIGETGYATLQDAFNAVGEGDTIVLQRDLTQDDGVIFDREGVSSKLDLNSHTLTVNSGGSYCNNRAVRIDAGTLEVYGGTIVAVGSGTTSSNGAGCYGAFRVEANGKLNAHDLTLTNARPWGLNVKICGGEAELTNVTINSSYGGGIEVTEAVLGAHSKAGKATVTDCSFTQTGYFDHCSTALSVSGGSELTVNSGTFQSENYVIYVFSSGGFVTVNGGTYTATGDKADKAAFKAAIDTNSYPNYTGGLKLNGGTFNGSFDIISPASTVISGGNYSVDVTKYLASGYEAVDNGDGTFTVQKAAVAQIGEKKYTSLAEAIAAVPTDGTQTTITMIGDETIVGNVGVTIPNVMNVVLDLNGHTVNQIGPEAAAGYLIKNNGTLTIKDSSDTNKDGTGNGKMTTLSQDPDTGDIPSYANNLISNYGNLTIESGFYQQLTEAGFASYVVDNYSGATSNITGGKLTNVAPRTYVVRMFLNSTTATNTLNISGTAVLSGSYAVWMQYANKYANKANLNVSGGRLEATDGSALFAGRAGNNARNASEIEVSITDGYIGGTGAWFGADTEFKSMTVSGGTFADFGMSVAGGNGILTGGTYESVSLFCEGRLESQCIIHEGYKCIKDGNVYKIVPSTDEGEAVNIYPDRTNQVYYYWLNSNGTKGGGFYDFYAPFEGPDAVLMDQEFIELLGNVTLTKDVEYLKECSFGDPIYAGGTFNLTFGTYDINLNGFAFPLPVGVSVITDKQTNIFTPEDASLSSIRETANSDGTYTYSAVRFVAKIGETGYATLQDAFDAVGEEQTIVLQRDLTQDDGVIFRTGVSSKLDLNNKTLRVKSGSNWNNRAVRIDAGTLEVYGGTIVAEGSGTNSSNGTGCYGAFRVEANGKLNAHDLTLTNARPWGLNVKILGGEAVLTKVTINSTYGGGIEVSEADLGTHSQAGKATVTKCTFTQEGYFDHCSTALSVSGGSELTVDSCTIQSKNHVIYVFSSGGYVTVNGGTYTDTDTATDDKPAFVAAIDTNTYPNYTGGLKLNGGTFTGSFAITSPASTVISGGTFSVNPSEYVAAGYAAAKVEDENVWKVGPVTVTELKPQGDATETAAKYTATTVVTDENNVQHEVGTNQTVSVAVVEENNVGEDVKLSDFQMNEVVTKAVAAANTGDNIDVQLIVKAAEPVVSGETVTFEVHPEAIITVNGGTPTNVELTNDDLAQGATFTFVLDVTGRFSDGAAIKVVHKSEGYKDETFYSTVIGDKVTVSGITHFSDFELSEVIDYVAQVDDIKFTTLEAAFDYATQGSNNTVYMLHDVTIADKLIYNYPGTPKVTLNLRNHTLYGRTNIMGGILHIEYGHVVGGSEQALNVYGSSDPTKEDYSWLIIGDSVDVTADDYAICLFGATAKSNGYGARVDIDGINATVSSVNDGTVFVSGNLGQNISGDMHNVVNINGTVTSTNNAAVALHGNATVNVQTYASITGHTGIAVKRGTLNVAGGTIVGNGEKNTTPAPNDNGTELTGAGISVSPTYSKYGPISVNISRGEANEPTRVQSVYADALFKQEGNYVNDATIAVSGGIFSSEVPEEFCAEGYRPIDHGNGIYSVTEIEYEAQLKHGESYVNYASLQDALAAAADGDEVYMMRDVTLSEPLNVNLAGKAVTLNLGAHTLTGRTNLKSGSLTLTNGHVVGGSQQQQALNVYGSSDSNATNYSVLTIGSNVNVTAEVYGVCLFGATYSTDGYGAVVNINGRVVTGGDGKNGAVFVSGNLGKNISGDMHNVVNINGTVTSNSDAAVALNGNATVNVLEGASVMGATGIAVKRGTLNMTGGHVYADGVFNPTPDSNNNGTEMTGAGISMSPTYSQYGPMSVVIKGGEVKTYGEGSVALFKQAGTYQSDATFSVSGGLFSSAVPKEFCAEGYQPKYDQTSGKYTVATFEAIWADKDIVLTDGIEHSYQECVGEPVTQDVEVRSVTYKRNVLNANTYCAWYVPADYRLTSDDLDQFDFYRINLIANAEGGNEIQNTSRIWVYLFPMAADDVLTANRPYVFKTKGGDGQFTFTLENTLHAPATDVRLNNSTTAHNYDFYGTYETTELSDNSSEHFFYVDYYGQMGYPGGDTIPVGPYRWYIKTTQKGGGAYYAPTFVFTDDSNVTGITDNLEVKTIDCYYDLKGMKIEKPGKGAYLVKFKDGTVKKVVK